MVEEPHAGLRRGAARPVVQPHADCDVRLLRLPGEFGASHFHAASSFFDDSNNADGMRFTVSAMTSAPSRSKNFTCPSGSGDVAYTPAKRNPLSPLCLPCWTIMTSSPESPT